MPSLAIEPRILTKDEVLQIHLNMLGRHSLNGLQNQHYNDTDITRLRRIGYGANDFDYILLIKALKKYAHELGLTKQILEDTKVFYLEEKTSTCASSINLDITDTHLYFTGPALVIRQLYTDLYGFSGEVAQTYQISSHEIAIPLGKIDILNALAYVVHRKYVSGGIMSLMLGEKALETLLQPYYPTLIESLFQTIYLKIKQHEVNHNKIVLKVHEHPLPGRIYVALKYNLEVNNIIKQLPERNWDMEKSMWDIPQSSCHLLIQLLRQAITIVDVSELMLYAQLRPTNLDVRIEQSRDGILISSGYNMDLNAIFKKLKPVTKWENTHWFCENRGVPHLITQLENYNKKHKIGVKLTEFKRIATLLEKECECSGTPTLIDYTQLPMKPYAHQIEGAQFLLQRKIALLNLPPSMGKTYTSILAAKSIEGPKLIVVPEHLQDFWVDTLTQLGEKSLQKVFIGRTKKIIKEWTIISYETFCTQAKLLNSVGYQVAIIDESSNLKKMITRTGNVAKLGTGLKKVLSKISNQYYLMSYQAVDDPIWLYAHTVFTQRLYEMSYAEFLDLYYDKGLFKNNKKPLASIEKIKDSTYQSSCLEQIEGTQTYYASKIILNKSHAATRNFNKKSATYTEKLINQYIMELKKSYPNETAMYYEVEAQQWIEKQSYNNEYTKELLEKMYKVISLEKAGDALKHVSNLLDSHEIVLVYCTVPNCAKKIKDYFPNINSSILSETKSKREQSKILNQFEQGKLQLLICTSVGLEIPMGNCKHVIINDLFANTQSYITLLNNLKPNTTLHLRYFYAPNHPMDAYLQTLIPNGTSLEAVHAQPLTLEYMLKLVLEK